MKNISCFIAAFLCAAAGVYAEPAETRNFFNALNPFWSFLWTGSWEHEKSLINRGDFWAHIPRQTLSLRFQIIDKRQIPPWEDRGLPAFSGGLYHKQTGSRLLYGVVNEWGLSARIRNPWSRGLLFAENRLLSGGDLQTSPSSSKEPVTYLYLRSPPIGALKGALKGFIAASADAELNCGISGGFELRFKSKRTVSAEGFYTGKTLDAHTQGAWFSETPPLPERDFRLYAASAAYAGPFLGFAADWAYSDTFAYGRDMYGNAGVRIGNRPWRLSLAAEGAGNRYVGRDGAAPGAGFRLGGKLERYGGKAALFQVSTVFRSSGFGEPFERSSSRVYYRFPGGFGSFPVKPVHLSLTLARNASARNKIEDSIAGSFGVAWRELRFAGSGTLTGFSSSHEPLAFPIPEESLVFGSAKFGGELSYRIGFWGFKTKFGGTFKPDADPLWDAAFHLSVQGKRAGLSFKAASPDFPARWTYTLAWRFQKK
ncbi:MAG: hypothetical protein LBG87_00600 [Spirochaetaceae bacterium]|jgi:hypothetical protein|nr:hypothetical protein [Spirochaetaceae bacterium]